MTASVEETTFAITDPGYTSGGNFQNAFRDVAGYTSATQDYANALVFHLDAGLSDELKTFTRDALERLDTILKLDFQETGDDQDPSISFNYRIDNYPDNQLGATDSRTSSTTGPGGTTYELDVTVGFEISSGVALTAYPTISDKTAQTILHEMGHSLGLSHPYGDGWQQGFSTQDTLMSYYWSSTGADTPFFREADIKALVGLWGSERPLTADDWFVQGGTSSDGAAPISQPIASGGGGGGGVVIIPRESTRVRGRSRGSSAASSRPSRGSSRGSSRGALGDQSGRRGANTRTGVSLRGQSGNRRTSRSSRMSSRRSDRLMAIDPITNPGRQIALQTTSLTYKSTTNLLGSSATNSNWLNAWNQELQAPLTAHNPQLPAALPTNWL